MATLELTEQDFKTLIEAIDIWEKEKGFSKKIIDVLTSSRSSPDQFTSFVNETMNQFDREVAGRKENAIMLRAKLLHLKDLIISSNFYSEC